MPVRHRQFPGTLRQWMFVLPLALAPACCTPPQPAQKPADPAPEPPASPAVRAVRPILRAAWSFQTGPDACIAVAKAGAISLQISIGPEGLIRLSMVLPGNPAGKPNARFSGPAGRWLIQGSYAGRREALFMLARDETSLSRILVLLSGGMLNLEPAEADVPILSLPESGADGQQWFACARRSVI